MTIYLTFWMKATWMSIPIKSNNYSCRLVNLWRIVLACKQCKIILWKSPLIKMDRTHIMSHWIIHKAGQATLNKLLTNLYRDHHNLCGNNNSHLIRTMAISHNKNNKLIAINSNLSNNKLKIMMTKKSKKILLNHILSKASRKMKIFFHWELN